MKLLRFDVQRNRQAFAVDFNFEAIAMTALDINTVYSGGDVNGDEAFTLVVGFLIDADEQASVTRKVPALSYFTGDSVLVAAEAGATFL